MVNTSPGGAIVVTATGATPFATPTSTVCSGAPPRQPFPNTQYGPPPGTAIIPVGGQATPTPSSHGPSPTPSSGSGGQGGFGAQPPGYPNRQKYGRMRGNTRQPLTTPPASPAKNRGKGKFYFFNLCCSRVNVQQSWTLTLATAIFCIFWKMFCFLIVKIFWKWTALC